MAGIEALRFTADRSIFAVSPYRYGIPNPFGVLANIGNCDYLGNCILDAHDAYTGCLSQAGLSNCSAQELATDRANRNNPLCVDALAARRLCVSNRDAALQICEIQYACPPTSKCVPDLLFSYRGLCCPNDRSDACGGHCWSPCVPPHFRDKWSCTCICPPSNCPEGLVQDPDTCECACPSQVCAGGKILDPQTCTCMCPPPLIDCSGICVNTSTDPQNCGDCNVVCGQMQGCCDGACVDLDTDQHCGGCAPVPQGSRCCNRIPTRLGTCANCSRCGETCGPPGSGNEGCCSGHLTDLNTSANCGQCGIAVPQGQDKKCCRRVVTQLGSTTNCNDCGDRCAIGATCVREGTGPFRCQCPVNSIVCGQGPGDAGSCADNMTLPEGPAWPSWRAANPTAPVFTCPNGAFTCNPSLVTIRDGNNDVVACCPPGFTKLVDGLCAM
jgi:CXCXC repeat